MRFIELHPDADRDGFDLHPRVTVLRGLQPFARVQIVGLAHSVAMGEKSEWSGRVEVHGVRMALDDALDLMGETAPAALVIDAGALPGAREPDDDDEESITTDDARRIAGAAADTLESEIADIAAELASAGKLRGGLQAHIASSTARIDDEIARRLDQADGDLRRAATEGERPDPWTGTGDPDGRIAHLEALMVELDDHLDTLRSGDRGALAAAIATTRASLVSGDVASPRAQALREIWTSLHQRLSGLESRIEAHGDGSETVEARRDAAREAAHAAEAAATPRLIENDESERLAVLHDEVLELERKASRGVRRGAARSQLEDAQGQLNDALEALGYPTWSAYRMGNGVVGVPDEDVAAHERARAELEEAETAWAELMTRLERDVELQEVLGAIEQVHREAVDLIGSDPLAGTDDSDLLAAALADVVVDAATVAADPREAVEHLTSVLEANHVAGLDRVESPAAVVALGESWLDVLHAADEAAVRVLRDRERAAEELEALRTLGDGTRVDRLDEARAAVREIEVEIAETRAALIERAETHLELHVLAATELAMAEEHDTKVDRLEATKILETEAERRLPEQLRNRRVPPLKDRIPRGIGGPVPVVVAMGSADPRSLDVLLRLPEDVQFLIVGDAPGIDEWAEKAGPTQVAVIEPGVLV